MSEPAAADSAPPAITPLPRRRRRRGAWIAAALIAAVVGIGVAAAVALLYHPAALPWLMVRLPGLRVQGVQGTLAGGRIRIASLDWALPGDNGRLRIDGLQIGVRNVVINPHDGALLGLHLSELAADSVRYDSGAPSATPPQAPTDLHLPLALQVDSLRIGRLQVDKLPPLTALRAALQLGADGGALHRIDGFSVDVEQARLQGSAQLAAAAPLTMTARLQADHRQSPAWSATLSLAGPLARLAADARLQGEAPARGAAPSASAQATLRPFAAWPLEALTLATRELDLAALSPRLPRTALGGSATVQSSGMDRPATVQARLSNALPGAWDSGRVPVQQLTLQASGEPAHPDRLSFERIELQLGDAAGSAGRAGRVTGSGRWQGDALTLSLVLDALQPARLDRRAAPMTLAGPLTLRLSGLPVAGAKAAPQADFNATLSGRTLDGSGAPVTLKLRGEADARHLLLQQAEASAGSARASATVDARADAGGWRLRGGATLAGFDPLPWWRGGADAAWRRGPHRIDGRLTLDVHLRTAAAGSGDAFDRILRQLDGEASLKLTDSVLSGMPLSGALNLHSQGSQLALDSQLTLAGNQLQLQARLGGAPAAEHWQLALQMPAIAALAPLGRLAADAVPQLAAHWPSAGSVQGELQADGRWPALRSQGELRMSALANAEATLQQATLSWRAGPGLDDPLALGLDARGLAHGVQRIDALQAKVDGSLRTQRLSLRIDSPVRPPAWAESVVGATGSGTRVDARALGRWLTEPRGSRWQLQDLQLTGAARDAPTAGTPWLQLRTPAVELRLDAGLAPLALRAEPGRIELLGTALNWQQAQWQAAAAGGPGQLALRAELEQIDVARLLAKVQPALGWGGDLKLGGRLQIGFDRQLDADIGLERSGGDLTLTDELGNKQALKLSELRLALGVHDGLWQFAQGLAGERLGQIAGAQVLHSSPERLFPLPTAPLTGVLEARVTNLGAWGAWVPPGWRLTGDLHTSASFGGTLGAPELSGEMHGKDIGVRNLLQGVNLSDGELSIKLAGERARIERFVFKGGDGTLTLTGGAELGAAPAASLQISADHFRLLGSLDRRIVVSGKADVALDAERLRVDGKLHVDEGLIDLSRSDAPSLDDDVVVSGDGKPAAASAATAPPPKPLRNAQVTVDVDFGDRLRLRGRGIDTELRGKLVASSRDGRLAMNGALRTAGGKFVAYGQKLDIQRGEIDFYGPANNPRLNVLAVRPNLDVVVGVTVTGTATSPRIRLYSDPDLPEMDKLSWLLLGRGPDGLGRTDTALLQRAAVALLAGNGQGPTDKVLGALGLTDFGIKQSDTDTRETVVSLGKQLSDRWYVGYERSVNATAGTWQLIYRAARRFTLRAQSGSDNSLDVIWSWRW